MWTVTLHIVATPNMGMNAGGPWENSNQNCTADALGDPRKQADQHKPGQILSSSSPTKWSTSPSKSPYLPRYLTLVLTGYFYFLKDPQDM